MSNLACPKCECPLSRIIETRRLTTKIRNERHEKVEATVIREQRVCDYCEATFYTRRVEPKAKTRD